MAAPNKGTAGHPPGVPGRSPAAGVEARQVECQARMSANSASRAALGLAPTTCLTGLPPWKTSIVGIDRIWYCCAISGLASMSSLAMVTLSPCLAEISSRIGATMRHGPHHSAQKSTMTGLSDIRTSASKLASVTFLVALGNLIL